MTVVVAAARRPTAARPLRGLARGRRTATEKGTRKVMMDSGVDSEEAGAAVTGDCSFVDRSNDIVQRVVTTAAKGEKAKMEVAWDDRS